MADPLTVACGAAQFIGLAGQTLEGLQYMRSLYQGIKAAPKLIKNIFNELKIFELILAQLHNLNVNDDITQGFVASLQECEEVFDGLYEEISKYDFDQDIDHRSMKKLWKQVLAHDNRPKFEEYLRRLERTKSSMLASLSALQLKGTQEIQDHIASTAAQTDQSFTRVRTDLSRMESTLERTGTGITSITMLSERIYTNSVENKDNVQSLASALQSIDASLRNLKTDIPQMVEEGVQRCLEDRLDSWKENWQRSQPAKGIQLQLESEPQSRSIRAPTDASRYIVPPTTRQHHGNAFARKKTFAKNIPLPFGFLQTKAIRKIVHEVTDSGLIVEKETLRLEISVLPFRWLSTKGRYVSAQKVFDQNRSPSWNLTMRTHHIIPKDSMIILACENRDIEAIRKLFAYRKASPFDVDSNGASLLTHTVAHFDERNELDVFIAMREVISFLTSQGADPTGFLGDLLERNMDRSHFKRLGTAGSDASTTTDMLIQREIESIWSLCLERCQADPFADIEVLERIWKSSMGGRVMPPLDPSYLFHDRFSGLDDLVFEHPDGVFSDLVDIPTSWGYTDVTWQQHLDQKYETLVYLCNGGEKSIKANIFSRQYSATVKWQEEDSCYCPSNGTHLLFKLLYNMDPYQSKRKSTRKLILRHLHRMLILLLKDGEIAEATCACKGQWQRHEYSQSPYEIAADQGVLRVWTDALEECGIDPWRIGNNGQYDGVPSLFSQEPAIYHDDLHRRGTSKKTSPILVAFFTAILSAIGSLSCWLLWVKVLVSR